MRVFFSIACLIVTLSSCFQSTNPDTATGSYVSDTIRYAQVFTIDRYEDYTVAEIKDPWDSTRILQRYVLVDREKPVPPNLPQGTLLQIPLRKIVVYTSVHASVIEQLGKTDQIIGVCEPQYMEGFIQEKVKAGEIADLGESMTPNVEKMIDIGAEVVIASPFQNTGYGTVEKLGVPIIEAADYMESLPLGRAEWCKFFGLLLGEEEKADSVFRETEKRYLELKALAASVAERPTVFAEKKYGSFWYVSAGESYTAHFFRDAGADYIFRNLPGGNSEPLTFETVLDEAIHGDFWLMKYNLSTELSYQDLRLEYTPYENFDAFKNKNIFTCNTGKVPYYEEFPVHPDYLLKDMIKIFHPDLLPEYQLRYYRPMAK